MSNITKRKTDKRKHYIMRDWLIDINKRCMIYQHVTGIYFLD